MTTISAKTIRRSRHAQRPDKVLSTLLLRYPRPIHAEFMTHRQLSKNSASSRAIPTAKLIQDVLTDPFVPLHWGKNQKGMQAFEEHDQLVHVPLVEIQGSYITNPKEAWLMGRDRAVGLAQAFNDAGYHKQIVNRILEPYSHITVLASGTEWSNFLALRDHSDAEPHIRILAQEIRKELDREDNIQVLKPGEWHMPFVSLADQAECRDFWLIGETPKSFTPQEHFVGMTELAIKKSVACCASTSYKTVDGFNMTLEKAIALHDKLVGSAPLHASPAEHVAQADEYGLGGYKGWSWPDQHGNFIGFRQYRKMLPNECL